MVAVNCFHRLMSSRASGGFFCSDGDGSADSVRESQKKSEKILEGVLKSKSEVLSEVQTKNRVPHSPKWYS